MKFWDNFVNALIFAFVVFFAMIFFGIVLIAFAIAVFYVIAYLFGGGWFIWLIGVGLVLIYSIIASIYLTIKDRRKAEKEKS